MADLILEFGCSPCYLQNIPCGADCTFELRIDLNQLFKSAPAQNYFHQTLNGTFKVKKDFFHEKVVPDIYRYDLRFDQGQWQLFEPNSNPPLPASKWEKKDKNHVPNKIIENNQDAKNILIILESPHKDEYAYIPDFVPLQPANDKTGKNFH